MNIFFDYQAFSLQKYGGISRYFYEIANRLAESDHNQVEIFSPLHINRYLDKKGKAHSKGIRIPHIQRSEPVVNAINAIITRMAQKRRANVDIFHETYYTDTDNCPLSAKRVVTVHDMIHEKLSGYFSHRNKVSPQKLHAIKRADHIICVSENTKKDLMTLWDIPEHKTSVVYHGYSSLDRQQPLELPDALFRPYILYVGPRDLYKNFDGLLHAYGLSEKLKNEFRVICFGGGSFNQKEKELVSSLKIPDENIIQLSGPDGLLASLYASASIFVYPSLYEGFGIPVLEAISFDCPVACSKTSSLPEVAGDAAEYFDPENVEDIASAIQRVVFSAEKRQQLIGLGREQLKLFSWQKCADDTLKVYEKVLNR